MGKYICSSAIIVDFEQVFVLGSGVAYKFLLADINKWSEGTCYWLQVTFNYCILYSLFFSFSEVEFLCRVHVTKRSSHWKFPTMSCMLQVHFFLKILLFSKSKAQRLPKTRFVQHPTKINYFFRNLINAISYLLLFCCNVIVIYILLLY